MRGKRQCRMFLTCPAESQMICHDGHTQICSLTRTLGTWEDKNDASVTCHIHYTKMKENEHIHNFPFLAIHSLESTPLIEVLFKIFILWSISSQAWQEKDISQ